MVEFHTMVLRTSFETNCCHAVSLNKPILSYQITEQVPRKYQLSRGMTEYS